MTATCIVQARMGSARLPGKSMEPIGGLPAIEIVLRRLARAKQLDRVVLATSDMPRDDVLATRAAKLGFDVFRGSETDLVARFIGAAAKFVDGPFLVRATGDNVFMDWDEVDRIVSFGIDGGWDFVGWKNDAHPGRQNDFAAEFLRCDALERVAAATQDPHDREHVFPYFYAHPELFKVTRIAVDARLHTKVKLDLDYPEDLKTLQAIGRELGDPVAAPAAQVAACANRMLARRAAAAETRA
jgi:spore coat polysaccharide biosynthesis protein SpsF (cytidylyltransferase family)